MEPYLNLNRVLDHTLAEGPGNRFCLWTQGCLQRCPGCCNSAMLELLPAMLLPVSQICRQIKTSQKIYSIEGITLLGGEPFLQAHSLALVAQFARSLGLSVIAFTGYELAFLQASPEPLAGSWELLACCDVLIDGSYQAEFPDTRRNWVGSTNQRFHYLTPFYHSEIETDPQFRHVVELRMNDETISFNGCPKTLSDLTDRTSLE